MGRAFYLAIQQDKAHERKKGGPSQNKGPLHTFLSPELTLEIPYIKLPVIKLSGRHDGSGSFLELKVGSQKMDSSFGRKIWKPKPGYWDVWREDYHLGIHLFGLLKVPFMRYLVFAWYFARQHEYIILFSTLLHEIASIISIWQGKPISGLKAWDHIVRDRAWP